MRTTFIIAVASILLLGGAPGPAPDRPAPSNFQFDVTIAPVTQDVIQPLKRVKPGMFRCSAFVHDAEGSIVLMTRNIVIAPGGTGEERKKAGELDLYFKAGIDRSGERARTLVTLSRAGEIISVQRSSVWLQRLKGLTPGTP